MTTPRVTVPVEPTEAMMDAWHRSAWPQGPKVSPMSQAGLAFKRHYAAMLTAAPVREEGGAVLQAFADEIARIAITDDTSGDDAFNALNVVVDYARELSKARPDPDDTSGDLHGHLFRNPALATREEAPACKKCGDKGYTEYEGGGGEGYPSRLEIEACSCLEAREGGMLWLDVRDVPQDGTPILLNHRTHGIIQGWFSKGEWSDDSPISPREYSGDMWILGDDLYQDDVEFGEDGVVLPSGVLGWLPLSALRAQPQAREEAQPVAWRDVKGFEDAYEVSDQGDVRRKSTGRVLAKNLAGAGYVKAELWQGNQRHQTYIHRLVAEAFLDITGSEVNHKNGDKTDNRATNLEWCDRSDNVNHAYYELGYRVQPLVATNPDTGEVRHYRAVEEAVRDGFASAHIYRSLSSPTRRVKGFRFTRPTPPAPEAEKLRPAAGTHWWHPDNDDYGFTCWGDAFEDATDGGWDGPVRLERAQRLPDVWAVPIDMDTDGDGEADDYEVRLFATEAEALAALQQEGRDRG